MNAIATLPRLTDEMRRWMVDQLIEQRPRAAIVADFIDTFPDFCAGQSFEVIDKILRSRIKNMMSKGKERDEIIERREARLDADDDDDDLTLDDSRYRRKERNEIYARIREINWQFQTQTLSREERTQLKDEVSLLKTMRQELDAYERSEAREDAGWVDLHPPPPEDPWSHRDEKAALPPTEKPPKALPAPEPEPTEPEWWEKDDAEHLTV